MKISGITLTEKEYRVIEKIRTTGRWMPPNSQNATAQNLIKKGICYWNSGYDALILTQFGKSIEL